MTIQVALTTVHTRERQAARGLTGHGEGRWCCPERASTNGADAGADHVCGRADPTAGTELHHLRLHTATRENVREETQAREISKVRLGSLREAEAPRPSLIHNARCPLWRRNI